MKYQLLSTKLQRQDTKRVTKYLCIAQFLQNNFYLKQVCVKAKNILQALNYFKLKYHIYQNAFVLSLSLRLLLQDTIFHQFLVVTMLIKINSSNPIYVRPQTY